MKTMQQDSKGRSTPCCVSPTQEGQRWLCWRRTHSVKPGSSFFIPDKLCNVIKLDLLHCSLTSGKLHLWFLVQWKGANYLFKCSFNVLQWHKAWVQPTVCPNLPEVSPWLLAFLNLFHFSPPSLWGACCVPLLQLDKSFILFATAGSNPLKTLFCILPEPYCPLPSLIWRLVTSDCKWILFLSTWGCAVSGEGESIAWQLGCPLPPPTGSCCQRFYSLIITRASIPMSRGEAQDGQTDSEI